MAKKIVGVTVKDNSEESSQALQELLINTYEGRDFNKFHYFGIDEVSDFSSNTENLRLMDFTDSEDTRFTLRGFTIEHWAKRIAEKFKEKKFDYLVVFDELNLPEEEQVHVFIQQEKSDYNMLEDEVEENGLEVIAL